MESKVQYRIHKSSTPVPILSQANALHISKIHPNIIHPPTSWSSYWSLSPLAFPPLKSRNAEWILMKFGLWAFILPMKIYRGLIILFEMGSLVTGIYMNSCLLLVTIFPFVR
jgi:hypothetical protein